MEKQPAISVIIPTYNRVEALYLTLKALQKQSIDRAAFEVIIVDDGSTENTEQVVNELDDSNLFRFVRQKNQGPGTARNLGASLASGDVLLFLDIDIVLDPDVLAIHLDAQEKWERVIITSRILPITPNPFDLDDLLFQKSFDFGWRESILPWHSMITQCLSIKTAHFKELGAFATNLVRGEDIEFGYRAERAEFEIRYCPQSVGWHNHALDLQSRCRVERRSHQHLMTLFDRYPLPVEDIQYLRFKWPVDLRRDSILVIARKLFRRFLAWRPVLSTMEVTWKVVQPLCLHAKLLERLYWGIVGGYQLLGLRDGKTV